MDPMMEIAIAFSGLNVAILFVLLFIYTRIAIRSRASHSFGLVLFVLLLLANSALTVFAYSTMSPFFGSAALPYLSTISVLEFVGLVVLLKITL
jgi:hypothetical protein